MEMKRVEDIPVVWRDPPPEKEYKSPTHYRAAVLAHFRAQLIARPGQWAVLPMNGIERGADPDYVKQRLARSRAASINKSTGSWGKGGAGPWEAKAVGIDTYVRFVPQETTTS